jgi:hypothetical protein
MDINYEDKNFGMTFGNRYRVNSFSELFNSLYSEAPKSANTVNFQKDIWGKPVKSGKFSEMNEFISSAINLTTNAIRSSKGQSVNIDESGLISKKVDSNEQLWLTNNAIAFSDDGFITSKTAIGKISMPDGETSRYGIAGDAIIGEMIAGTNLKIADDVAGAILNVMYDTDYLRDEINNVIYDVMADEIDITKVDDLYYQVLFYISKIDGFEVYGRFGNHYDLEPDMFI